jgi:hypothetical protein
VELILTDSRDCRDARKEDLFASHPSTAEDWQYIWEYIYLHRKTHQPAHENSAALRLAWYIYCINTSHTRSSFLAVLTSTVTSVSAFTGTACSPLSHVKNDHVTGSGSQAFPSLPFTQEHLPLTTSQACAYINDALATGPSYLCTTYQTTFQPISLSHPTISIA